MVPPPECIACVTEHIITIECATRDSHIGGVTEHLELGESHVEVPLEENLYGRAAEISVSEVHL